MTSLEAPVEPTSQLPEERLSKTSSRGFLRSWQAQVGIGLLCLYVIVVAAGLIWNPDGNVITTELSAGLSRDHPFGTDALARDVFRRTVSGGDQLVLASISAALIAMVLGGSIGGILAYKRGMLDFAAMRGVDILLGLPTILVALLATALLPQSYMSLALIAGLLQVLPVTRVCRGIFGDVFEREFVLAAALRGEPARRLIVREAVPNVIGPLLVEFGIRWSASLLLIASINSLGVGVQPPTADWGLMLIEGRDSLIAAPWAPFFPAACIAGLAVAINFTADALAQSFSYGTDPRTRRL